MTVCLNSVTSAVFHPAAFPERGHDTRNSIELIVAVGWRLTGAGCPTSKRRSSIVDAKILRARRGGVGDGRRGQIPPSSRAGGQGRAKTSRINTTFILQLQKRVDAAAGWCFLPQARNGVVVVFLYIESKILLGKVGYARTYVRVHARTHKQTTTMSRVYIYN